MIEAIRPSVCRSASRNTAFSVRAAAIARVYPYQKDRACAVVFVPISIPGHNRLQAALREHALDLRIVRRPWRRIGFVAWLEVEAVTRPAPGASAAHLILVSGKRVVLDDISADLSSTIARIGHKQLSAPQALRMPAGASPYRERTSMEIEADVTRQAIALAEQRERLAAESRRLRGSS